MNIEQPFLWNVILKKKSEENLPRNAWAETREGQRGEAEAWTCFPWLCCSDSELEYELCQIIQIYCNFNKAIN